MKVLVINTEYSRGGATRIAKTLHDVLNESPSHESLFAYGRGLKSDEPQAVRFALQLEVYLHAFLARVTGVQGYGSWLSTRQLLRLIRNWKPNVVHFHNIHGYYLDLSIAKAIGKLEIPVVWTLHDGWPLTGRCAYLRECDRWKTGCGHCPDLSRYPTTHLDASAFMWRKKKSALTKDWNPIIVCPSQWLADQVNESYLSEFRIEVIPNGIDTQLFRPRDRAVVRQELGLPKAKKVVLFAAADLTDERKGARYFFESLSFVQAKGWLAVTVGRKIDIRRMLNQQVEIKQLGYVAESEAMAKVYNAADIFCITSLDDNFPTTVLESLACGTPVVGFRVGGIPEQVTEDCGILVEPRDAQGLGKAITQLLQNDALREKMGERCRARAVAEYSTPKFRDRYIKVYSRAIEGRGAVKSEGTSLES